MTEISLIRFVAKLAPLLAPLPSAFFIGRSVYYHLLYRWHPELGISNYILLSIAIIAGLAIELLAISSVYLAASLHRWNNHGQVKKEKGGWERAPFGLALVIAGVYLLVSIYLLVVLEAVPDLARYSAIAFPLLAAVAATNWALFEGHRDRLARYGMVWSFKPARVATEPYARQKPKSVEPAKPVEPPKPVYKPNGLDKAIMHVYAGNGWVSYAAVAGKVGHSKSTVAVRVNKLKDADYLVPGSDGGLEVKWNGHS